jgi:hypothetical protein
METNSDNIGYNIGQYLWEKVGSKNKFKGNRRAGADVVTINKGFEQVIVGVIINIGQSTYFVDKDHLRSLPVYSFAESIPNKVHMSRELQVPPMVAAELRKRGNDDHSDSGSDWVEDDTPEGDQDYMNILQPEEGRMKRLGANLPPLNALLAANTPSNSPAGAAVPPTPAPDARTLKQLLAQGLYPPQQFMYDPSPAPPTKRPVRQCTTSSGGPLRRRTKKEERNASYQKTIDNVATGIFANPPPEGQEVEHQHQAHAMLDNTLLGQQEEIQKATAAIASFQE